MEKFEKKAQGILNIKTEVTLKITSEQPAFYRKPHFIGDVEIASSLA